MDVSFTRSCTVLNHRADDLTVSTTEGQITNVLSPRNAVQYCTVDCATFYNRQQCSCGEGHDLHIPAAGNRLRVRLPSANRRNQRCSGHAATGNEYMKPPQPPSAFPAFPAACNTMDVGVPLIASFPCDDSSRMIP